VKCSTTCFSFLNTVPTLLSTMIPEQCSIVLPTFNESSRITATLKYYSEFSSIIYIIDNFSTDNTLELARQFAVKIISHQNNGSTESGVWIRWLLQAVPGNYYLFLSCSEIITPEAIASVSSLINSNFDLCYWPRLSFTENSESLIYGPISCLLGLHKHYDFTCRLASSRVLRDNLDGIFIHDNFRSFRRKSKFCEIKTKNHYIKHNRPATNTQILHKLLSYAIVDSNQYIQKNSSSKNPVLYLLRIIRELFVLFVLFCSFRLTAIRANEVLARIILHLQTYILIANANLLK